MQAERIRHLFLFGLSLFAALLGAAPAMAAPPDLPALVEPASQGMAAL